MLIPKSVFNIHTLCDPDSIRYALGGVRLERNSDGSPVAVACDGHRMLSVEFNEHLSEYPAGKSGKRDDFQAIIDVATWKEAAKLAAATKTSIKRKPVLGNVLVEEESPDNKNPHAIRIVGCDMERTRSIETRQLEGRFPKWRDAIPKYEVIEAKKKGDKDPSVCVSVNVDAKLLMETLKAVLATTPSDDGKNKVTLQVDIRGREAVVIHRSNQSGKATGVMMPLVAD